MSRDDLCRQIDEYANLERGWNGYGALPVTSATIDKAKAFLFQLPDSVPEPFVAPGVADTVLLEWDADDERWLIVNIGAGSVDGSDDRDWRVTSPGAVAEWFRALD